MPEPGDGRSSLSRGTIITMPPVPRGAVSGRAIKILYCEAVPIFLLQPRSVEGREMDFGLGGLGGLAEEGVFPGSWLRLVLVSVGVGSFLGDLLRPGRLAGWGCGQVFGDFRP